MKAIVGLLLAALLLTVEARAAALEELPPVELPPGFKIEFFAKNVREARSLEYSPSGTLFVGTRHEGKVYALRDTDGDFKADERFEIADDLNFPNGVAFRDGALYVAEINRILRYDNIEQHLNDPPEPVVVTAAYPKDQAHGWKFIAFGPDGYLYVPVGAPCNICNPEEEIYSTITRIKPDGTGLEIFARGIRNTVGFDWHPQTNELWFTDNGRDRLGDNIPPDELNHAPKPGLHFGYPFCHGGKIADPEFGKLRSCDEFVPPARALGPHVAALGMEFYTGKMFPAEYHNQIFIAEHGSWDRSSKIGFRITLVRLAGNSPTYETFASGWLKGEKTLGRPTDLLILPDGSLLVSDDYGYAIYRITYRDTRTASIPPSGDR